jgi:DNA polymerase elongation subunit (family B)
MKILTIDIETRPNLAYVWDLFGRNMSVSNDKLVETSQMICFAAKWMADDEPVFYSDFHNGHATMLGAVWALLDSADAVITYNGDHFDEPRINRELLSWEFWPPSPYKSVDLYKVIRKRFAFPSGKLDFVAQELGLGAKVQHNGFELWKQCMADDSQAWDKMKEYNKQDVLLTEELFRLMLPWIPGLPSYGAERGEDCCPGCGATDLRKEGHAYTKTGKYQRFVCRDCGVWSRATRRESGTSITQMAA